MLHEMFPWSSNVTFKSSNVFSYYIVLCGSRLHEKLSSPSRMSRVNLLRRFPGCFRHHSTPPVSGRVPDFSSLFLHFFISYIGSLRHRVERQGYWGCGHYIQQSCRLVKAFKAPPSLPNKRIKSAARTAIDFRLLYSLLMVKEMKIHEHDPTATGSRIAHKLWLIDLSLHFPSAGVKNAFPISRALLSLLKGIIQHLCGWPIFF